MANEISPDAVRSLLKSAGFNGDNMSIDYFQSGGNNTIYKVSSDNQVFALKKYKIEKSDNRDRLGAEWGFLSALKKYAENAPVPESHAIDREEGLGLYEFSKGRKLAATEIQSGHIGQVINFIKLINQNVIRDELTSVASEARFSAQGHLAVLIERLDRIENFGVTDPDFKNLLNEMRVTAAKLKENITDEGELEERARCISPSDFGFHNALADDNGKLTFIDFEYAGWDDPAKLTADFFFQPEITVDDKYYEEFLSAALSHISGAEIEAHKERARKLRPIFGLRWCCIILNPFNPEWAARQGDKMTAEELDKLRANRFNSARNSLLKTRRLIRS